MKKKKNVVKKWEREDEVLDLKELMDVEGGVENNEEKRICSLGHYGGGGDGSDPNDGKTEGHEG